MTSKPHWKIVKIKDLDISISDGNYSSKYPKSSEFLAQGVPFIRANNLKNNTIISEDMYYIGKEKHSLLLKGHLKTGDILVTTRGNLGTIALVPEEFDDANINAQIVRLRVNSPDIYNKYILYTMQSPYVQKQISKLATGTALKQLPVSKLREINIPLPGIQVQKNIVNTIDCITFLQSSRQQSIQRVSTLSKSIFSNMFGDPIQNDKNWDVKKLKDLSNKILSGNTPKGGDKVYVDKGILFLRSQNVWRNNLILDDVAYITGETHKQMKHSSLKHKDLLMTKTGRINTENSSLGRAAIYLGEDDSANINGHVYLIRLKDNVLHEFILFILTTGEYRRYIRKTCVGGIDKRQLNKIHLEHFPIIYPPIEKQKEFVSILQRLLEEEKLMQTSLLHIEDLYKSTIQKIFSEAFV